MEKQVEVPHVQFVDKVVEVPEVRTVAFEELAGPVHPYSPTSLVQFDGSMSPMRPVGARLSFGSARSPYTIRSVPSTPAEPVESTGLEMDGSDERKA